MTTNKTEQIRALNDRLRQKWRIAHQPLSCIPSKHLHATAQAADGDAQE